MAGAPSEVVVARQHKVLEQYLSPAGLGKHNVARLARELGCSERTVWYDLKKVREEWSKNGNPVAPTAETVHARIEAALEVAWDLVRNGEDAETALKALDRVYKGIDLQAKVAGAYAPERHEVVTANVSGALTDDDLARFAHWQSRWDELEEKARFGTLTEMERHAMSVMEGW